MVWRDPATIPTHQFLYGCFYARGVLSASIGAGGIGKGLLRTAELLAMATQRALLGIMPRERVRCLFWRHRGRFARARGRGDRAERKTVVQSTRVCLIEPLGRGNSEAIASRSLFAVDLELGAFQY
jgi:hypothetical protein